MTKSNKFGAVASGHQVTTNAAREVMQAGGTAFDGAIAAAFAACVCEPVLASPAGGGFAQVRTESRTSLIDFFAQTPLAKTHDEPDFVEISADFGSATQKFHIGNASAATPGFLPGLIHMYKKYARLELGDLLKPAIRAAREGVRINRFQSYLTSVVAPIVTYSKGTRNLFAPNGALMPVDEIFYNEQLAAFFESVIEHKQKAFPIDQVVKDQKTGGHLRHNDFNIYQVVERESLQVNLNGSKIFLNPPPSAAGQLIVKTLQGSRRGSVLDIARALGEMDKLKSQTVTLQTETGMPATAPAYRGTTHISVIDAQRNACSITLSNGEGNGYMVGDYGFMMNNMLGEADINPGGALGWPPDTRMSSMMCPTIVEDSDGGVFALGSGGSNRIRSVIFQVLVHLLVSHETLSAAIAHPRLHVEDGHLDFEAIADLPVTQELKQLFADHRLWPEKNMFFGGCHAVAISRDGRLNGVGDSRRSGNHAVF